MYEGKGSRSNCKNYRGITAVADPGGAMAPPLAAWKIFFRQYINIITKPTAYDGPWEY